MVALMFVMAMAWQFLTFNNLTNDHYGHVALAQQILLGDLPIRDFADPGWPLTYLLSAVAWRVGGGTLGSEWTIVALGFAVGAAFTWAAARRLSASVAIAVLVTSIVVVIHPRTYSYPKILVYAVAGWALIHLAVRPRGLRLVVMAAVVAIAFLFRHDHGLFIGVASVTCILAASRHDGWRSASRRVAAITATTAALLLPWIMFVSFNGGLVSYFMAGIEFSGREAESTMLAAWPRFQLQPNQPLLGLRPPARPEAQVAWTTDTTVAIRQTLERRFTLEYVREGDGARFYYVHNTTPENLRALADDVHVAGTAGLGRLRQPAWREFLSIISPARLVSGLAVGTNASAWLFWMFWFLPLLCAVLCCRRLLQSRERWPGELAAIAGIVVLAVLVNATFIRDALDVRLPDAVVPQALLGAWALGIPWTDRWRRRTVQRLVQLAALATIVMSFAAVNHTSSVREMFANTGIGEGLDGITRRAAEVRRRLRWSHREAAPSRYAGELTPFFRYLDRCTSHTDRLIVTGEFPDVLVAAGRPFASDGVVFGGGYSSEVHQDRTVQRLRERPALFAIHMSGYDRFRSRFTLVDRYLADGYRPMAEIPVEGATTIRIVVDKSRVSTGTDADTGWPCFVSRPSAALQTDGNDRAALRLAN